MKKSENFLLWLTIITLFVEHSPIADLMGHSDVRTTRRYVRATERNKREAVEAARLQNNADVHKLATNRKRQPLAAAVTI